jgi:hypothetical protein
MTVGEIVKSTGSEPSMAPLLRETPSFRSSTDDDEFAEVADASVPSDWTVGIGPCRNLEAATTAGDLARHPRVALIQL